MCIKQSPTRSLTAEDPSRALFSKNYLLRSAREFPEGDLLTSPVGVLFLLTALLGSGGARGNTGLQIARGLRLRTSGTTSDLTDVAQEAKTMNQHIRQSLTSADTMIDNEIRKVIILSSASFVQANYSLRPNYRWSMENEFETKVFEVDYRNASATLNVMNHWVDSSSKGLIRRLFSSPNEISPNMRLSFFTTIYLKDQWMKPFDRYTTRPNNFRVSEDEVVRPPMMHIIEYLRYGDYSKYGYHMISKPLKSERFSFVVVLPTEYGTLKDAKMILQGGHVLSELIEMMTYRAVSLQLPKFRLQKEIDLRRILESMDIVDLFRRHQADLSGMTTFERLYIQLAKQDVVLRLDEFGVETAAVSGAVAAPNSALQPEVEFHVNRPFVCFIYDRHLQIPVMAAVVEKPIY